MTVKFSVSLPDPLFRAFDSVRREKGSNRSAAIQSAIRAWIAGGGAEIDYEYLEAYRRQPESPTEIDAWSLAATEAWGKDESGVAPARGPRGKPSGSRTRERRGRKR